MTNEELSGWFAGNIPDDWFTEAATIGSDRDEIVVTGNVTMPKTSDSDDKSIAATSWPRSQPQVSREAVENVRAEGPKAREA